MPISEVMTIEAEAKPSAIDGAATDIFFFVTRKKKKKKKKISAMLRRSAPRSGFLVKEGRLRKNFKLRWFSIDGARLVYSASPSGAPKGDVNLAGATVDVDPDVSSVRFDHDADAPAAVSGALFCHRLRIKGRETDKAEKERVLLVVCSTRDDQTQWLKELNDVINFEKYVSVCAQLGCAPLEACVAAFRERRPALVLRDLGPGALSLNAVKALGILLVGNETFTSLVISKCGLSDALMEPITTALGANTTLLTVSFTSNRVGNQGAADISQALLLNTTVTSLDLSDNEIGNDGVSVIAEALQTSASLRALSLRQNLLGRAGLRSLAAAISANPQLEDLDLSMNDLSVDGGSALAMLVAGGSSLRRLCLHRCIVDTMAPVVDAIVQGAPLLEDLDLSGNKLTLSDCQRLVAAAPRLKHVDLGGAAIEGGKALAALEPFIAGTHNAKKLKLVKSG
jgi:hypothetical protein